MAEINKLSVGKALDKLRSPDAPKSKRARHDEKAETLNQEIQSLRAARHRLERDQKQQDAALSETENGGTHERSSWRSFWRKIFMRNSGLT